MSSKAFTSFGEQLASSAPLNKEQRPPRSSHRLDQDSLSRHTEQHVRGWTYSHSNVAPAAPSNISALDPHPRHTHWAGIRLEQSPSSKPAQNADSAHRHRLQISLDLLRSKHTQVTLRLAETQAHLAHISERKARLAWHQFVQSPREYLATHEWVGASAAAQSQESRIPSPLPHSGLRGKDGGDWEAMQRILRFLWEAEDEARDELGRLARNAEHLASMMEVGEAQLATLADEAHERKTENMPPTLKKEEPSPGLSQSSTFVNWPVPEEPTMTGALPIPDDQHQHQSQDVDMNAQTDISVVESVVNVLRMLNPRDLAAVYHHLGLFEEAKRLMESLETASDMKL